ncbi:MAG: VOC family protein [Bacteroidales bacterium]|nr:VOC family protein [Bacteroidales bacterium]
MKRSTIFLIPFLIFSCIAQEKQVPEHFKKVDQVVWIIDDLDNVIMHWGNLGFDQVNDPDTLVCTFESTGESVPLRMAKANLGGAHITWIQPMDENSLFATFHSGYGDGAMSLVHRLEGQEALDHEIERLAGLGVDVLEKVTIETAMGELAYVFMDTQEEGKYILGYTTGDTDDRFFAELSGENLHHMKINQYAFAIADYEPVSAFWARLGQPEFQINHPVLGDMHYYGELTDHSLIQGWQRHGTVAYEWCIPVKPPIVYDDHIKKHGEGIHHLAFSVSDMDEVLGDYESKGYINSMGGTWGEKGKPGSGRYEYIDLEKAGGVTVELLWNHEE